MTQIEQIWKTIQCEPLYEVSNYGEVRHKKRKHILKPKKTIWGYYRVCLSRPGTKNGKWYSLHRLVAITFIPNPNSLPQVNHRDGDKTNNNVSNLEWVSAKENIAHAKQVGLIKDGDTYSNTRIHKEKLVEVFALYKLGFSENYIGELFGVSKYAVSVVLRKKRYLKYFSQHEFDILVDDYITNYRGELPKRFFLRNGKRSSRPIIQKDSAGNFIRYFNSIKDAAEKTGSKRSSIQNNLKGRSNLCGGFKYEYKQYEQNQSRD